LMPSRPESHVIAAVDENRLAAWADPVSFRQREQ
jgi:hypothetical protein